MRLEIHERALRGNRETNKMLRKRGRNAPQAGRKAEGGERCESPVREGAGEGERGRMY